MSSRGFTLVELLIAMSIFALLGMGAYQLLQTVTTSHARVTESAGYYTRLNLAFSIIQRDMTQFVPRGVRDEYGNPLAPLVEGGDYIIEFTRGGWRNPAGRLRARLQRVAYSLDDDSQELTRHFWNVLDRAEDTRPVSQVLLTGVTDFRVIGLAHSADPDVDLEPVVMQETMPLMLEVIISMEGRDDQTRRYQLVEAHLDTAANRVAGEAGEADDDEG